MGVHPRLLFGRQAVLALAQGLEFGDLAVDVADLALGVPEAILLGFRQRGRRGPGGTPGRAGATAPGQDLASEGVGIEITGVAITAIRTATRDSFIRGRLRFERKAGR